MPTTREGLKLQELDMAWEEYDEYVLKIYEDDLSGLSFDSGHWILQNLRERIMRLAIELRLARATDTAEMVARATHAKGEKP